MQMFRSCNGQGNKSRLEDIVVPFGEGPSRDATLLPAVGAQFRRTTGERATDWHPAPRRQLIVWIAGREEVLAGDGSSRAFSPGDLFLADDTAGEGHVIRNHGEALRLWVHMPDWSPQAGRSPLPQLPPGENRRGPQLVRIYTGEDGRSHFEELTGLLLDPAGSREAPWTPVTGVQFRRSVGETFADFHHAPRRQIVVSLSGEAEVEAGSGEKRRLLPGDVLLAEDTTGQGHISRHWGDRRMVFVGLAEGALARGR